MRSYWSSVDSPSYWVHPDHSPTSFLSPVAEHLNEFSPRGMMRWASVSSHVLRIFIHLCKLDPHLLPFVLIICGAELFFAMFSHRSEDFLSAFYLYLPSIWICQEEFNAEIYSYLSVQWLWLIFDMNNIFPERSLFHALNHALDFAFNSAM